MCQIVDIPLLEKVTFLKEVKAQWFATIFLEPTEPLSVDLPVHLNPEEEREDEQEHHPKPEWEGFKTKKDAKSHLR